MCGIFGYITSGGTISDFSLRKFNQSIKSLYHRGPDDQGQWHDCKCFLGFRHLAFFKKKVSIQPLHNEDYTIHLVCNGEIFNYKELRSQFPKHHLKSISDCELIIHLYEEKGEAFINEIKGQFAFILWDSRKQIIIAARDRFGICPLYYTKTKDSYYFSSDVKSLLKYSGSTELNIEGMIQTLFLYGPDFPKTCFEKIYQIPPGTYLKLDIISNKLIIKQYWELCFSENKSSLNKIEILNRFKFLLTQSIKKRLHGEFIPGIYASGGLDSSAVAAITSQIESKTQLFSIQFTDKSYDESFYQTCLAKYLNLKLHSILISDQDILDNLIRTIWHIECPLIRTAPIPMFLLSKAVRSHGYKCVLSGEGADELLAGYPVFQKNKPSILNKYGTNIEILNLLLETNQIDILMKNTINKYGLQQNFKKNLNKCQTTEIDTKLSRYLLAAQGDKVSMAHGIEQRFPYLDEDLVDFIKTIPCSLLISKKTGKIILREAMKDQLPKLIVERPKRGYMSPNNVLAKSYKKNNLILKEVLSLNKIKNTGYFDVRKVKTLLSYIENNDIIDNKTKSAFIFLASTQILHELFISQNKDFLLF